MAGSEYYNHTTYPSNGASGSASAMRAELESIESGFGKLPDLSGNGSKIVAVNSGGTALEAVTTTGTGNGVRATSPTFTTPNIGAATATTVNGMTLTSSTGTFTLTNGKTFSVSNTLTLAGTDGSTLNVGTGGTLGTAAYTASTAYAPAAGSTNITTLGTIATGTWNGSVIPGQYGGTGVANTGKTITLGGNLTTSGAYNATLTLTGDTNVTFPTSGTLATTSNAGAMVPLSTVTASNSATIDIETTFDSTYDVYLIVADSVVVQTDGVAIYLRMKLGGSYVTTASYSFFSNTSISSSSTYAAQVAATFGQQFITLATTAGNDTGESSSFKVWVYHPSSTSLKKTVDYQGVSLTSSGEVQIIDGAGGNSSTSALTGIRIYPSSGNIVSGSFRLYGIRNS